MTNSKDHIQTYETKKGLRGLFFVARTVMRKFLNKRKILENPERGAYNKKTTQGIGERFPGAFLWICHTAVEHHRGLHKAGGGVRMKNHRFWAWAMVFCLAMTLITGYQHK